jgi:hypothetical protein
MISQLRAALRLPFLLHCLCWAETNQAGEQGVEALPLTGMQVDAADLLRQSLNLVGAKNSTAVPDAPLGAGSESMLTMVVIETRLDSSRLA